MLPLGVDLTIRAKFDRLERGLLKRAWTLGVLVAWGDHRFSAYMVKFASASAPLVVGSLFPVALRVPVATVIQDSRLELRRSATTMTIHCR